jgi:hypothetical protein
MIGKEIMVQVSPRRLIAIPVPSKENTKEIVFVA